MKIDNKTRRPSGFTLIELLVVITIVAVLAAMSFAGVNAALKKARKTEGTVAAAALSDAVERFYSEYNRLPDLPENMQTDAGPGVQLLTILLGDEGTGSDSENPRQVVFLEAKEAKAKKGGIDYGSGSGGSAQGMYDPFGNPFNVVLNTNYDDTLSFSYGGKQYNLRGRNVAVYSAGADQEEGTVDDITTFQR
ncbi:prepilin-type N-terminal cleavage/methylation domain-containing protein [Haloferula rosea]|uniref:Type II secretion system protein n=1 Tax=Haloferula rosea TaxID=490093 RepID=A0A934R738_9BACT|nr:prepilin-type N-terminal cleavage/methylation domain-containing protein [Haloferula rosea]MBK1826499.1 type II secretion system protein [Haloferula rosea]